MNEAFIQAVFTVEPSKVDSERVLFRFLRQRRAAHGSQIFMTQDKGLTVNAVPDNDGTGSDKDFNPQTMAKTRYQIFRTSQFRPSESQKRTEARKMR